jgi:hypothetical protein
MTTATLAPPAVARWVPLLWPGRTIVCLASGPSLTQADVDLVCGRAPIIAINAAIRIAPWADVFYSGAWDWWTPEARAARAGFRGLSVRLALNQGRPPHYAAPGIQPDGVITLRDTGIEGLETVPTGVRTYKNSGGAAINLAVHLGAARIVLLGYDMQPDKSGRHHFDDPGPARHGSPYLNFRTYLQTAVAPLRALGVEVVNCTRSTALTCWPRVPLEAIVW